MLALPGRPEQPFSERFHLLAATTLTTIHYISLAMVVSTGVRAWPVMGPAAHAWLVTQVGLNLLMLAWRRRDLASYARWRVLPAALFRIYTLGLGALYSIAVHWLETSSSPPARQGGLAAAAHYGALLLVASHAVAMMLWWAVALPLGWAAAVQLIAAAHMIAYNNPLVCATAALTGGPTAAGIASRAAALMESATFLLSLPAPLAPASLPPQAACCAIMAFCQLALGCALPCAAQALLESRLWRQHQQQRAAAGLAPERVGWRAYHWVLAVADAIDPLSALFVVWLLASLLWSAATAIATVQAK